MFTYGLCGLRLESEFPLPELAQWQGAAAKPPDVRLMHGSVPEMLEGADHIGKVFQTRGKEYLLAIPGSPRFLIRNGNEVIVAPITNRTERDTRALLSGPVQGVLYHQRGLFPLHASVVASNGVAIAIAGPSGSGKSTLAAALSNAGLCVVADDICVVQPGPPNVPQVLPAHSRLRLWRDAATALGRDPEALPRALSGKEKFFLDAGSELPPFPLPLRHIVLLKRESSRHKTELTRIHASAAVQAISSNVYVRRPAGALGLQRNLFLNAARVAAHAHVWRLQAPDHFRKLPELVDTIKQLESLPS